METPKMLSKRQDNNKEKTKEWKSMWMLLNPTHHPSLKEEETDL